MEKECQNRRQLPAPEMLTVPVSYFHLGIEPKGHRILSASILAVMMELPLQRGQTGPCANHMSRQSLHLTRR